MDCTNICHKVLDKLRIDIPQIDIISVKEAQNILGYMNKYIVGFYDNDRKIIYLISNRFVEDHLIHEIGHYIHDKYFGWKQIRFSTKVKPFTADKNYIENFAVCFEQWFYGIECERTRKMGQLLKILKPF
jgi:Zn-dependent peptidase ImmA (M78 family)